MHLRSLSLKVTYRSVDSDILNEFLIPCLQNSVLYKRAVGYFTSASLAEAARGIVGLVQNGGRMLLVASPRLTEEEIDQLIAGCGKKTAAILQTLKETGMRIGECLSLKWTALNEQANILTLNTPEKNSLPRIFNISPKLVLILQSLPKTNEKIFGLTKPKHAQSNFSRARKKIARKVGNPRLSKIHFHLIRHWFGTMEYHKKPDPDYVRRRLGHKSLQSTQIYINMEQALFSNSSNEYHVKIAQSVEQAMALIEVGFEYVTGEYNDGGKIFRKRK